MLHYIVGYTADDRGHNAVDLAVSFARGQDARLTLVLVLPSSEPFEAVYPPTTDFDQILTEQAHTWLAKGIALVPEGIPVAGEIRRAESLAEGLIAAAEEHEAAMIVIGTAKGGLLGRATLGSVASVLLHASTVPVAVAPLGYTSHTPLSRITCAIGNRAGADDAFEVALTSAVMRQVPLRVLSLLALDHVGNDAYAQAQAHAEAMKDQALERLDNAGDISALAAHAKTIEDAVETVPWDPAEVVIVGSSRLAERSKLFIGSTANKMLRTLPVPMVVVPRNYDIPPALDPFRVAPSQNHVQNPTEG